MTSVRRAVPDDAATIARISVECWQTSYANILPEIALASLSLAERATRWRERLLLSTANPVWVAERDGAVVGFVAAGVKPDRPCEGEWFVFALYVDPRCQGSGAGRRLLAEAHDAGPGRTWLSVFVENTDALAFYRRCGGTDRFQGTWEWLEVAYPVYFVEFEGVR